MSEQNPSEAPVAYEEVYVNVPQWPKVVGGISIGWALINLCCTGWGIFNALSGTRGGTNPGELPEDLANAINAVNTSPTSIAGMVVGLLVVVLLPIAGILTILRKPAGRLLHLAYSVLALVQAGLTAYGFTVVSRIMRDWMAQNQSHEFAKAEGMINTTMTIMLIVVVGSQVVYPLFTLIWFGLVKRTAASMTGVPDSLDPGMTRM